MRCDLHCPPAASGLRAPLLAVAALGVLALGVYVVSLLGGVLVAATVAVYVTAVAGAVVWVRKYVRRPVKRVVNPVTAPAALPPPSLAIEAPRPAVVVLGVDAGEKVER